MTLEAPPLNMWEGSRSDLHGDIDGSRSSPDKFIKTIYQPWMETEFEVSGMHTPTIVHSTTTFLDLIVLLYDSIE